MEFKIITDKISNKHNDSFWYDGDIASVTKKNGTELLLIASGEIQIRDKDGYVVFDGNKMRNDGIKGGLDNDTHLKKIGNNYDDKYYWEYNNWFEVIFKPKDEDSFDCNLGVVAHSYDDALELLNSYIEDDTY